MKTHNGAKSIGTNRCSSRGSAVIMVFALITIVGALAVSNNAVLANLQRELRLVEKRQLVRTGDFSKTNLPPVGIKSSGPLQKQTK